MKYIILTLILISTCFSNETTDNCLKNAYKDYKDHNVQKAFDRLKGCEESIMDSDDPKLIARYYHGLATCYRRLEVIDSALKYQNLSVSLKENYGFTYAISDNYNELAMIYKHKGLFNKSVYYLNLALDYNQKNSPELVHINYLNLANSYENLNLIDTAVRFNLLALNSSYITPYNKTIALFNLSDTYNKIGEIEKSLNYLDEAISSSNVDTTLQLKLIATRELYKLKNNENYNRQDIFDYYNRADSPSDINYSKFCLSILYLKEKYFNKSFDIIKDLIENLEKQESYKLASNYIESYKDYSYKLNLEISNSDYLSDKSKILIDKNILKENKEYQNDLLTVYKNKNLIKDLNDRISKAELNNQVLFGLLILSFFVSNFTFFWYRKHRVVRILSLIILKLKTENQNSNRFIINNLAKVMFVLHYKLDEDIDEEVFKAIDESINELDNSNQKLTYYSNKLEENYAKTESTV